MPDPIPPASGAADFRTALTDTLRYWEPRRLAYNTVLLLVFLAAVPWSSWRPREWIAALLALVLPAVAANLLYCAAHAVDVVVQMSDFRMVWRRFRWLLLLAGIALAVLLELGFLFGMMLPDQN